jgi:hypothetical protein
MVRSRFGDLFGEVTARDARIAALHAAARDALRRDHAHLARAAALEAALAALAAARRRRARAAHALAAW